MAKNSKCKKKKKEKKVKGKHGNSQKTQLLLFR